MNEEKVQKEDGAKEVENTSNGIPLSPYSNLKREITEDDLKTPAVQRILLSEVDKLENRCLELEDTLKTNFTELSDLKEKFHKKDKEKEILDEKFNISKSHEILYSFCLTSGSAIIGFSKIVWDDGYGGLFITFGILLILGGVISKAIKWK